MLLETVPVLATVWFLLIAVLWIGFFFLEGFDFGVAMLLPILGKGNEKKKRVMINTVGPVWDGNEVWLITAGGAMFAAFPGWYASLFSGLYIPLLLVLIGLIIRGVAFEYRAKHNTLKWKRMFDWFLTIGSFLPTVVLGVGFANFAKGISNDNLHWDGALLDLFTPFALLGGLMLLLVNLTHGATFIALKTNGPIRQMAENFVKRVGWVTVVVVAGFVIWQNAAYPANSEWAELGWLGWVLAVIAIVSTIVSVLFTTMKREGWGFAFGGVSILAIFAGIFVRMYGNLGFVQNPGYAVNERLNIVTAASSETTLAIMTVAAIIFVPVVVAYQIWTYWVFSKRISTKHVPDEVEAAA